MYILFLILLICATGYNFVLFVSSLAIVLIFNDEARRKWYHNIGLDKDTLQILDAGYDSGKMHRNAIMYFVVFLIFLTACFCLPHF